MERPDPMTVEQGPRIVNDLGKVARFLGVTDPAELTHEQELWGLSILGTDASIVVWECGIAEKP